MREEEYEEVEASHLSFQEKMKIFQTKKKVITNQSKKRKKSQFDYHKFVEGYLFFLEHNRRW